METIALDFETFYSKDFSIEVQGSYGYTHGELFDPYMVSVSDGENSWAGHPSDFNWESLRGNLIVSHNAAFDRTVYLAMVEQGLAPRIEFADWVCSANMTSYLCNRRSLAESGEYLLGHKADKGMRNYMKGRSWSDAKEAGKADALLEYARMDAVLCHQLWDKFAHKWPSIEQKLSRLTIDQCTRGVQINTEYLDQCIAWAQESMTSIESTLPWIEEGKKPTSPKAVAEECRKHGIPAPPIKSHEDGEEHFEEWVGMFGARFPWVAGLTNYRSMGKVLSTLERIKEWLRPDGTMPFSLKYFGGHTGRWSGAAGLNMQNLRKDPIYLDDRYLPIDDSKKLAAIAAGKLKPRGRIDVRALIVPRPGKKMIISDLSQIEPRVLAWLAGDTDFLEKIRGGMSVYEVHARQSLGWTGGRLKDEDAALYKRAKAEVLALGYGCGAGKYVSAAFKMAGYVVDPEVAQAEVTAFRSRNPKITGLWKQLDTAFKNSLGGEFEMGLPSWRSMRYPAVKRATRFFRDEETGKTISKLVYTADVGGRRKSLYGGLLTENCLAAETEVLTDRGWIKIQDVALSDRVWDGSAWVSHSGVVSKGVQPVIDFGGVQMTPDHKVLVKLGWVAAEDARHEDAVKYYLTGHRTGMKLGRRDNLQGQKIGGLEVLAPAGSDFVRPCWLVKCKCGRVAIKVGKELTKSRGKEKFCGQDCRLFGWLVAASKTTHGMSKHPAFAVYHSMKQRCNGSGHQAYKNYGGRGIHICREWDTFEGFWADMGPSYRAGLTLDRIDNDGPYCKGNCRWATREVQGNNKRSNVRIGTPWGPLTVSEAARKSGVNVTTLLYRLGHGCPPSRLFDAPDFHNRFSA